MNTSSAITLLERSEITQFAPSMSEIIDLVENIYCLDASNANDVPTKIELYPDQASNFMLAMPASLNTMQQTGLKWVSYYPNNSRHGMPDSTGLVVLNDWESGSPVAILEGMWITYARTAACVAVGAKHLSNKNPTSLGLVGAGGLGRWSLRALSTVFPSITNVKVASRTPASREGFCTTMSEEGDWTLEPVDDVAEAVEGMDIVVSSTSPTYPPPLRGEWFSAGTTLIPLENLSAWDDETFERTDLLVTDNRPHLEMHAHKRGSGLVRPEKAVVLGELIAQDAMVRSNSKERVVFVPSGPASVDISLSWHIYRRAIASGVGTEFNILSEEHDANK